MPSSFIDNQLTTNIKSVNKSNATIDIIEKLCEIIRYKLSDNRLMKKAIYVTYKLFIYFIKYMSSKN